jgi:hypothetical protein
MQHALQVLQLAWHWVQVISPWLVTLFIPSLIVGLTPYPKAAEAVSVLKAILNFLSVLAHSDSPGTFKAPFTMSRPPAGGTPPDATSGPNADGAAPVAYMGPSTPPIASTGLLFAMAAIAGSGCASGVYGAYQTLGNTAQVLEASTKAFESFDHDHQLAIVKRDKDAGHPEQSEADLAAYHDQRAPVAKAFIDAGATVQAGYALLPLVERGLRKDDDLNAWLTDLFNAAQKIRQALVTLGVSGLPAAGGAP